MRNQTSKFRPIVLVNTQESIGRWVSDDVSMETAVVAVLEFDMVIGTLH